MLPSLNMHTRTYAYTHARMHAQTHAHTQVCTSGFVSISYCNAKWHDRSFFFTVETAAGPKVLIGNGSVDIPQRWHIEHAREYYVLWGSYVSAAAVAHEMNTGRRPQRRSLQRELHVDLWDLSRFIATVRLWKKSGLTYVKTRKEWHIAQASVICSH